MNSTLKLYVCLSNPARSALIANGASRFAPPAPEFVVRDTVTLEIRFYEKVEGSITNALTQVDLGVDATLTFGAKIKADILTATDFLFATSDFVRTVGTGSDVYWTAALNLNTDEFNDAFDPPAGPTAALVGEIEIQEDAEIRTAAQFDASGVFDVIRGGEGVPVPSTPPLPSAPITDTFLGGTTGAWIQRTVAQTKTLLAYTYTEITGLVAALNAKLDDSQLDTDGTLAANSDAKIASQKAAKTYADTKIPLAQKGAVSGVAPLGADGKIDPAYLPKLSLTETLEVADESARLALISEEAEGQIVKQLDTGVSYGLPTGLDPSVDGNWVSLGDSDITASDVGGLSDFILGTVLTGLSLVTGTSISSTDSILVAAGKLQAQITALFGRTISGGGLATGGGDLSANRTITVTASTDAQAVTGTATNVAMTPAGDKAALDARFNQWVRDTGYIHSDGVMSNRAQVQIPGARGNLASAPLAQWCGWVNVASTAYPATSGGGAEVARLGSSPTLPLPSFSSWGLYLFFNADELRLSARGAGGGDARDFYNATFRTTYSGQKVWMELRLTAGAANPVILVNGVDVSSMFTAATFGTSPDWLASSLDSTYHLTGFNWPAGEAPLGCWLNAHLTQAESDDWRTKGKVPAWVQSGGSMTSVVAGSFVTKAEYVITSVGSTDFTAIGASANTVGVRFTSTGAGSGTGTAVKAGALSLPSVQPIPVLDDATGIGGNAARLVGMMPITPKTSWRISANTLTSGNEQLLGGDILDSTKDVIDLIEQTTTGTPTTTVGHSSGGAQYKASSALSAGINPATFASRKLGGNAVWVGSDTTDIVRTTITGHRTN